MSDRLQGVVHMKVVTQTCVNMKQSPELNDLSYRIKYVQAKFRNKDVQVLTFKVKCPDFVSNEFVVLLVSLNTFNNNKYT